MKFLSTLSLRRATPDEPSGEEPEKDFYPRSPCGERRVMAATITPTYEFLSTLSLRRATSGTSKNLTCTLYFYPRSPCGERLNDAINGCNPDIISIHALLAESDLIALFDFPIVPAISIHALLAESDWWVEGDNFFYYAFLSTLSLWRATGFCDLEPTRNAISIHALLAESDSLRVLLICPPLDFYPRSPCGERPPRGGFCYLDNIISIHALLAESD